MEIINWVKKVDYTLLEECELNDLQQLCQRAIMLNVKSVCVYPKWVQVCSEILKNSAVLVCTVIDFPDGQNSIESKIIESKNAIADGADELDLVLNYKKINETEKQLKELIKWSDFTHNYKNKLGENIGLKVIVESGLLSIQETEVATRICIQSGVDFIKTSTGKVAIGAEIEKVKVMQLEIEKAKSNLQIKASGGIRTLEQIDLFNPYVNRFGMGCKTVDTLIEDSKGT
jgi:deoxyribose-phosphate aldolase